MNYTYEEQYDEQSDDTLFDDTFRILLNESVQRMIKDEGNPDEQG
jgi:hypothetical protein